MNGRWNTSRRNLNISVFVIALIVLTMITIPCVSAKTVVVTISWGSISDSDATLIVRSDPNTYTQTVNLGKDDYLQVNWPIRFHDGRDRPRQSGTNNYTYEMRMIGGIYGGIVAHKYGTDSPDSDDGFSETLSKTIGPLSSDITISVVTNVGYFGDRYGHNDGWYDLNLHIT